MVCSSFDLPKTAVLDDWLKAADKLNKAAEKIKKAGMITGCHNHQMEFAILDNKLIYDALMKRFNADLVKMQFQTEVITLGYKASTYFNKYPGQIYFISFIRLDRGKKGSAHWSGHHRLEGIFCSR